MGEIAKELNYQNNLFLSSANTNTFALTAYVWLYWVDDNKKATKILITQKEIKCQNET